MHVPVLLQTFYLCNLQVYKTLQSPAGLVIAGGQTFTALGLCKAPKVDAGLRQ